MMTDKNSHKPPPDALLFIAPGCPHCPTVLEGLSRLVKDSAIGTLEVVNIAARPDRARDLGIRSVPWTRVGPFVLEGLLGPDELRRWAERATKPEGVTAYLEELLGSGRLPLARTMLAEHPEWMAALLPLVENSDTSMHVRIGVSALFEAMAGSAPVQQLVPELARLAAHSDHRVRSDACHYLGLSASQAAMPCLRERLRDENAEVREIAAESLEQIQEQHARG
jgi:hypothetical protein